VVLVGDEEDINRIGKIIREEKMDVDLASSPYLADFRGESKPTVHRYAIFIKDPKVSKGTGLLHALNLLDLKPAEVAVIGDADSDLSMFEVAGFKIAVANASEKLKAKADLITNRSYDPGGTEAIEYALNNLV